MLSRGLRGYGRVEVARLRRVAPNLVAGATVFGVCDKFGDRTRRAEASPPEPLEPLLLYPLQHNPLRLNRHPQRLLPRPMLGVGRVVLDRRVEPDPVALLVALVEGRLQRPAPAAAATTPAASPSSLSSRLIPLIATAVTVRLVFALVGRLLFFLGLGLTELGLDLRLDLVAEVDVAVRLLALRGQPVAMTEVAELCGGNADLMGDPGVRPALANLGANLVELGSEGLPGHRRRTLDDSTIVPWQARANPVRYSLLGSRYGSVPRGGQRSLFRRQRCWC